MPDREHQDNIKKYLSLFKGRDDVFAIRWENKDKSGYMPAYEVDWNGFDLHKSNGGTFKDYPNKKYLKLNQQKIIDHLDGNEVVGIYPLLSDNTSWFLAVDFDEKNWKDEILKLYEQCQLHKLTAYIERSRSGNGGHLWIFFEQPYPAIKSRTIIKHLLNKAGISLKSANASSFDRIFPNQDFHTGKGLGNLIALPLQKAAMEEGNSCFINPLTLEAYSDQWDYLATIKKVTVGTLEEISSQFGNMASQIPRKSIDYNEFYFSYTFMIILII
jgi:hypothetical protein